MKEKHILFSAAATLLVIVAFITISVIRAGGWDNWKLRYFSKTAYLTLTNNPLLPSYDADVRPSETGASRIDTSELFSGGPPKDGIPSIDEPQFDTAATTSFASDELVLGVVINGEAKAYPYGILNWHEIVNDTIGGVPVAVTYCPLCDTGITFDRTVGETVTTFGVSGKIYQSCLVMYDRLSDTLWVQPWGVGVVGAHTNAALKRYPTIKTTLGHWLAQHPESLVLSIQTGYERDYFRYPYGSYDVDETLLFPVRNEQQSSNYHKRPETFVAEVDDTKPFNAFGGSSVRFINKEVQEKGSIDALIGSTTVTARWDTEFDTVRVYSETEELPSSQSFGFVYPGFFQ